jgi:hypothetical protein
MGRHWTEYRINGAGPQAAPACLHRPKPLWENGIAPQLARFCEAGYSRLLASVSRESPPEQDSEPSRMALALLKADFENP